MPYTTARHAIPDDDTLIAMLAAHLATGAIVAIETANGPTTIGPYQSATGQPAYAHYDPWHNRTIRPTPEAMAAYCLTIYDPATLAIYLAARARIASLTP